MISACLLFLFCNSNKVELIMSNLFHAMTTDNLRKLRARLEQAISLSRSCSIDLLERFEAVEKALAARK